MRYGSFSRIVEPMAGVSRGEADRAARAVLRTLAERVTRGEADDIAAFLPTALGANIVPPGPRFEVPACASARVLRILVA
jgi:uncharacterized protein (DUF2267 family)